MVLTVSVAVPAQATVPAAANSVVVPAAVSSQTHPRFLSFVASVNRVSEADPYVDLEARLDGPTESGQRIAIYDAHTRTLIRTCTGYACSAIVRTGELAAEAYIAYVSLDGDTPEGDTPAQPLAISQAVHVSNVGWVAPVSAVSFTTSATQVSENAPYSRVQITWDHSLPTGFYTAVYDDTGTLAFSCTTSSYCNNQVRPAEDAARTYRAYVVQGTPAATGGPVDPQVTSEPITITNTGDDPAIGDDTEPRIDAVTVLNPVVYQNASTVRIAVDLNKAYFGPFYVGVYDETGDLVNLCSPAYNDQNTCVITDSLAQGESHTYTAYLTQGTPPTTGGPGAAQVGDGVSTDPITGLGWSNAGIKIDAVTVLNPVVYQNSSSVRIAVDLNKESYYPFYVGIYDETGTRVGYCDPSYSDQNTCLASDRLAEDESHTYTAYLTQGTPPTTGPPANAVYTSGHVKASVSTGPTTAEETAGGSNPSEGCKDPCQGDPVNVRTGEFWDSITDLSVAGVGAPLEVQRNFSTTLRGTAGEFGHGWTSSYDMGLRIPAGATGTTLADASDIEVVQENGSTVVFTKLSNGSYAAPARVLAGLSANPDGTFTFIRRQNQVFRFSAAGVLVRVEDRNGQGVDLSYDTSGQLVGVANGRGGTLTFAWSGGRIASATDQTGRVAAYAYSGAGDLTQVTAPDGSTRAYEYDAAHRIVTITAPDGGQTTNVYDTENRVTTQTDALDRTTMFAYGDGSTTVTDPMGVATEYVYVDGQVRSVTRAVGTDLQATTFSAYGPTNQVVASTDALGKTTWFGYDSRGNRTSVTDPLGRTSTSTFDEWNNPLSLTNAVGETTTLAYDEHGNPVSQTNPAGETTTFTVNPDGTIASSSDPLGRVTTYTYDTHGFLATATGPDGSVVTTSYDTVGQLVATTDPRGNTAGADPSDYTSTFTYDTAGRRLTSTDPIGALVATAYDAAGRPTTVTDALDAVTTSQYDLAGQLVATVDAQGRSTVFTYDDTGRVVSVTDATGATASTTYDALGRPTVLTDPLGRTTSTEYDLAGRVTATVDGAGARTTYAVDAAGQVVAVTDPLGAVTTMTYDAAGRPVTVTDALDRTTTTKYDAAGRVVATTDPVGAKTTFEYDAAGQLTATVDAADNRTVITYDTAGRRSTVTDPTGATTTTTYDAAGNPVSVRDALGRVTTNQYDPAGRVSASVDAAGGRTTYAYDATGRLTSTTDPAGAVTAATYDDTGLPVSVTDALGRTTTSEYDAARRPVASVAPSGARTTFSYDAAGQLTSTTDPLGAVATTTFDAAGRPTTVTDADGRGVTTSYDAAGRPASVERADASTITWTYDTAGQVTAYTDAAGQAATYTYDAAGRVASSTDTAGHRTAYTYNALGQATKTTFPDDQYAEVTYDAAGRRTGVDYSDTTPDITTTYDAVGQVTQVTDGAGTTTYSYDDLGRPTAVTRGTDTVGYAYDAVGQLTALTYPGGDSVDYTYDTAGQLATVTDWNDGTYTYDWTTDGQIASVAYPNGLTTTTTHDDAGQILGITTTTQAGVDLLDLAYSYTDAGLLTDQTTTRSTEARAPPTPATTTQTYTWDPQARIAQITGTGAGTFTFDTADRLTTLADGRTLTYDTTGQPDTLSDPAAGTTTTFAYDDRGNRTTAVTDTTAGTATSTAAYNLANQLTHLTQADGTQTTYTYDATGLRTTATTDDGTGPTTEAYTWDTTAPVPLLLTDTAHAYIYGTGSTPIAQIDRTDQTTTYLHGDLTGSIRTGTDTTGQVVCDTDYDTYGQPLTITTNPCGDVTRFGYAGEYTDPTGYIYLRARYYDPTSAQFLTLDPLIDTTRNPYGYTAGNPLQHTDPLGLDWLDNVGDVVAGFGDHVSFGGTRWVRQKFDFDVIDYCSTAYEWGGYGGVAVDVALTATGIGGVGKALVGRVVVATRTMEAAEAGTGLLSIAGRSALAVESGAAAASGTATAGARGAAETGAAALPELTGTIAESFEGAAYATKTFKAGTEFYRAEAWSATRPGSFLGTEAVSTSAEAETAYNIAKWGNPAQVMRTYRLTEDVTMYYGRVAGGEGYQSLIPRSVDPSAILRQAGARPLG